MFTDTFVNFVLEKKLIDDKQAKEVLSKKISRVRPAIIAVYENFITEEQAKRIMGLQITDDMPFGFLAVREGYINNDQLGVIMGRHSQEDLQVLQIMSDKDIMSMNDVIKSFDEFREFYDLEREQFDELVANKPAAYVSYIGKVKDKNGLFATYSSVFIATFLMCLDNSLRISEAYCLDKIECLYIATIGTTGDKTLTLGFGVEEAQAALSLASRFVKQKIRELGPDVEDSMKEFLNMVSGMFITRAERNLGLDIDIQVPNLITKGKLTSKNEIEAIDFYSGDRKLVVFMLEDE